jgi:hypothetical protein
LNLLAERVARQIDHLRCHIRPVVRFARQARSGPAIISAGGGHFTNPNNIAVDCQRNPAIAFSLGTSDQPGSVRSRRPDAEQFTSSAPKAMSPARYFPGSPAMHSLSRPSPAKVPVVREGLQAAASRR